VCNFTFLLVLTKTLDAKNNFLLIDFLLRFFFECKSSGFNKISNYYAYSNISFNIPIDILHLIMKGQHFLEADLKYHANINQKVLLIESSNDSLVPLDESLDLFRVI
jgi:hypothetical protein